MAGRRLTPAEHALVVLAVRSTGNVRLSQAFAAGYFFFVNDDDEAAWLDSLMETGALNASPIPPSQQIVFPEWELPEHRSVITRAES